MQRYVLLFLFIPTLFWVSCISHTAMERRRGEISPRAVLMPVWERTLVRSSRFSPVPDQFGTPAWGPDSMDLFVGTSRGDVWALDLSGRVKWRTRLDGPVESRPLVVRDRVLAGTISGAVYALQRTNGKVLWKFQGYGAFQGDLAEQDGLVYALTSLNKLYVLTLEDGRLHWSREHDGARGYTVRGQSSPVLVRDRLLYGLSSGQLVCLDLARRGEILWTAPLEENTGEHYVDSDVTPVVSEDRVYTASFRSGVAALSLETGDVLWRYPVEGVTRMLLHRDRLYFVSSSAGLHCLGLDGRLLWRQQGNLGTVTGLQIVGRRLLVSFDESGLLALDPDTGFFHQKFDTGSGLSGGFSVQTPWLSALANNGRLYLFQLR